MDDDSLAVYKEVQILYDLQDLESGITRLVDFFVKPEVFHVVQVYAAGGDVFDVLAKRHSYTEDDMRQLACSLLETMSILHSRGIVHRDLKPENLLYRERNNDSSVMVADFGFARYVPECGCTTRCGTPAFVAPEIIMGKPYDTRVDMWSVGCLLYMLLCGYPPFNDKSHRGLFRKIKAGDYVFHSKAFQKDSIAVKQLISSFLTVDPEYRCTADRAMKHSSWINAMKQDELRSNFLSGSLGEIKTFAAKRKFRSLVHAVRFSLQTANFLSKDAPAFIQQMKAWDQSHEEEELKIIQQEQEQQQQQQQQQQQNQPQQQQQQQKQLRQESKYENFAEPSYPVKCTECKGLTPFLSQIRKEKFHDHYVVGAKINTGTIATVWECFKKQPEQTDQNKQQQQDQHQDQTKFAVKIIPRIHKKTGKSLDDAVLKEVCVLQNLTSHKNIVSLLDFFEEEDYFYLVMDCMMGGDVFDRIVQKYQYTEKDARDLTKLLLEAVQYIHSQGFAHRDLKPQNLLLTSEEDDADIKVADFGAACRVHAPQTITTRCGTPTYVAPEILKNIPYDQSADLWSVGVIVYVLLCGYPPFMEDNQALLFQKIRSGDWFFEQNDWEHISNEARLLITGLLQVEPVKRLTAAQALESKWINHDDSYLSSRNLTKGLNTIKKRKSRFKTLAKSLIGMGLSKTAAAATNAIKKEDNNNNNKNNNDNDNDNDNTTTASTTANATPQIDESEHADYEPPERNESRMKTIQDEHSNSIVYAGMVQQDHHQHQDQQQQQKDTTTATTTTTK